MTAPGGSVLGVVIAGGASRRMGREKAFVALAGEPLLAHVIQRLAPQVHALVVNARGDAERFAAFGREVIADSPRWRDRGPLGGVEAALRYALAHGFHCIATAPCDAPFLPLDLVARLEEAAVGASVCVAEGPGGLEPAFALWRADARAGVETALAEGVASLRDALARLGAKIVRFDRDDDGDRFANVNTPADLAAAEARLGDGPKRSRWRAEPPPG